MLDIGTKPSMALRACSKSLNGEDSLRPRGSNDEQAPSATAVNNSKITNFRSAIKARVTYLKSKGDASQPPDVSCCLPEPMHAKPAASGWFDLNQPDVSGVFR